MKNYMYVELRFKSKSMIQAYLKQKKKISHETLGSISSRNMTIMLFCFDLYSNLALQKGEGHRRTVGKCYDRQRNAHVYARIFAKCVNITK